MAANSTSPMKSGPLSERPTNTHLIPSPQKMNDDCSADLKTATTKSMEYHRQVLKDKLQEGSLKASGHYVSPSDGIMSPCTKKLSDIKGKKFKKAKPQALFAKELAKKSYEKINTEKSENDKAD